MHSNMLTPFLLAATASAAVIKITVGPNGQTSYSPASVTANVGDTVVWDFQSTNHDVAQGTLDSACQPAGSPFYSGFQNVGNGFAINITNTDPIWYYCSAPGHCKRGMAGVINPPSGSSISDYTSKASSVSSAKAPSVAAGTGGELGTTSALEAAAANQGSAAVSSPASSAVAAASSSASVAVSSASSAVASASSAGSSALSSAHSVLSSVSHSASAAASTASASASRSASAAASSSSMSAGAAATQIPAAVLAMAGLAAML